MVPPRRRWCCCLLAVAVVVVLLCNLASWVQGAGVNRPASMRRLHHNHRGRLQADPAEARRLAAWPEVNLASIQRAHEQRLQDRQSTTIKRGLVFFPLDNGADPSGNDDSTNSLQSTINQAFGVASTYSLLEGISDMGGAEVHLGGGQYVISKPLTIPNHGGGNVLIHGGTLRASTSFPKDGFLLELASTEMSENWKKSNGKMTHQFSYENIRLQNLLLDCNFTGGGILLLNPLRTIIENCYITHFETVGISVQGGHETLIQSSFLGQHITVGGDPNERNFGGVGIVLNSNDNAITDVVIFSAQIGIEVKGQANMITGVHCYNKASGWGGTGIMIRQGARQNRLLSCYMDYTGIVLEETKQITITNSFFLGDAYILLDAMSQGSIFGVSITNNMFSGSGKGIPIVKLNGNFSSIVQTFVDENSASGMALRSTRAHGVVTSYGRSWTLDLSDRLLFPNSIANVQYSFFASQARLTNVQTHNASGNPFPHHALQSISQNAIVVVSDTPLYATISTYVDQSLDGGSDGSSLYPNP